MECLEDYPRRCFVLTPSILSKLWDDCPRCFWLRVRKGVLRPQRRPPPAWVQYRQKLSAHLSGASTHEIDPTLPQGRCLAANVCARSKRIWLPGCDAPCILAGRISHLIRFDEGGWGLLECATADPGLIQLPNVSRRLHALAWALEQPSARSPKLSPIMRMGLMCFNPVRIRPVERGRLHAAQLMMSWIEIQRHDAAFVRFLKDVVEALFCPVAPKGAIECPYCRYVALRNDFEASYRHDGLPF